MDWLRRLAGDIQEVWNNSNVQTRMTLVASSLLVVFTLVALVLIQTVVTKPAMSPAITNLQPGKAAAIVEYLNSPTVGIPAEIGRDQTAVFVPAGREAEAAAEAVIGGVAPQDEGITWAVFDSQPFGMTRQKHDLYVARALETQLAKNLKATNGFRNVYVNLAIPTDLILFEDQRPTASVQIDTSRALTSGNVRMLQSVVAGAVPKMKPEDVTVTDFYLNPLSEMTEITATSETEQRAQFTMQAENMVAAKIIQLVAPAVGGRENIRVATSLSFDWEEIQSEIDSKRDPLPGRKDSTTEETTETRTAGEPGVPSNVPDASRPTPSAPTSTTVVKSTKNTTETDFEMTAEKVLKSNAPGTYLKAPPSAVVTVATSFENEAGDAVIIGATITDQIPRIVQAVLPKFIPDETAGAVESTSPMIVVEALPFIAPSQPREAAGPLGIPLNWTTALQYIPTLLLLMVAFVAFFMVLRIIRAAPTVMQMSAEEEVVMEPDNLRELSLAELGIRSPEDIAQLPPEDQRRIKLQNQLKDWAKAKPERVSGIIKTWMTE